MFGLIGKKDKAMQKGYQSYSALKSYIEYDMKSKREKCYTPKQMLDLLYNSDAYKNFVVDSLVVKKYCNKISLIKTIAIVLIILLLVAIATLIGLNILGIILMILVLGLGILFLVLFKEGKTYNQYYLETMVKILQMAVSEYSISKINSNASINKDYINRNIDMNYDKYSVAYNCKFESENEVGDDFNLELIDVVETKDKDGNTRRSEQKIFDGFGIVTRNKQPHNILKGNVIKIREDHNLLSSLGEDTAKSMFQNKREFSFNSEKLNKHLDCKISRNGFNEDVDQKMFEVTKIITPAFEERMLFLDERYNAFNMNLSDNEFSFVVNMKKDAFQKFQSGELFKFGSNYKDKEHNTNLFADVNFEYDRLYPILERLFLRKYFRVMYNYQMDSSRFDEYENTKVEEFETEIKEIMDMPWKEFSEINKDYVKDLKEEIEIQYQEISKKYEEELKEKNKQKEMQKQEKVEDDKEYQKEIEKMKENV